MARQCPRCGKPRTDEPHTCYLAVEDASQIEAAIEKIQRPDAAPPKRTPEETRGEHEIGFCWCGAHHDVLPLSDAAPVALSDGWVSCPPIQYAGREYAIVWQRDRPFLCCQINGRWMVEHAIGGPPSDAAPVAQLLYDTMPDMIIAILLENEIDPLMYAKKWAEAIGPLYAHPKDAPAFLHPCSFCGLTGNCSSHTRTRADPTCKTCFGEHAKQVEDAPGGPLVEAATEMVGLADMDQIPAPNACVWFNAFDRRIAKLRDALNRLKGEGEKDG